MRSLLLLFLVLLFGCETTKHIQLMETNCPNCKVAENKENYIGGNDSVTVVYSLWANGGIMSFEIHNNLNQPIYIDWKKSGLFRGDERIEYWRDEQLASSQSGSASSTYSGKNIYNYGMIPNPSLVTVGATVSQTHVVKPERISFLPAKSKFVPPQVYILMSGDYFLPDDCKFQLEAFPNQVNDSFATFLTIFNKQNSPLNFRNYITWSLQENMTNEFFIDNSFYISSVQEMNEESYNRKKESINKMSYHQMFYKMVIKPGVSVEDRRRGIFVNQW